MPRLPYGIAETALPSTGGLRQGTIGVPAAQEPGADPGTAMLVGRSAAELGQQIEQGGQYLVQAETYAHQRQRAQDVLDSTLGFQDLMQRYQPAIAERSQGDYRDLPQDVVTMGKGLIDQVALERKLSPQGKALFREKAEAAITAAQHNALQMQTGRRSQDTLYSTMTEIQQVQQDAMQAPDELAVQAHLGRLQGTFGQLVANGLLHGDPAAKMYRDTEVSIRGTRAEMAIETDPTAKFQELQGMAQGKSATTPQFQNLPAQLIAPLMTKAAGRIRENAALMQQQITQTQALVKQGQDKWEGQLWQDIQKFAAVPENLPQIQQGIEVINMARDKGYISTDQYIRLTTMAQSWLEKARVYTRIDDNPTKDLLQSMIAFSTSDQHLQDAMTSLAKANQDHKLTGETSQQLSQQIMALRDKLNPYNSTGAQQARQKIMDYAGVPVGLPVAQIATMFGAADAAKLRNALAALQSKVRTMTREEVDANWEGITNQIIESNMMTSGDLNMPPMGVDRLALPLQTGGPHGNVVPNEAWAIGALKATPNMTDAELGRRLQEYRLWQQRASAKVDLFRLYGDPNAVPPPSTLGPFPLGPFGLPAASGAQAPTTPSTSQQVPWWQQFLSTGMVSGRTSQPAVGGTSSPTAPMTTTPSTTAPAPTTPGGPTPRRR